MSNGWEGLFPQGPLPYQQPGGGDYVNQVSHRLGLLAGLLDPWAWQQALTSFPDPRTAEGQQFGRGLFGGAEGAQDLALNWGVNPMGLAGMLVHHGSPHKWSPEPGFPAGRPRLDKIGTGEGAQAYGHGVYFAQAPGVAKTYAVDDWSKLDPDAVFRALWDALETRSPVPGKAAVGPLQSLLSKEEAVKRWKDNGFDWVSLSAPIRTDVEKRLAGKVYSLDLPDERLPDLLDWDKPLSEQPEGVKQALDRLVAENPELKVMLNPKHSGGLPDEDYMLYGRNLLAVAQEIANKKGIAGSFDERAAEVLRQNGIPGLRYLDAASRGAGKGTANFVIWDQPLLDEMGRRMAKAQGLLPDIPPELPAWMPRSGAFEEARKAAMLPPEQGGLGLGPANTAAERAQALGFEGDVFHGRNIDFPAFDKSKLGTATKAADAGEGFFTVTNPSIANEFVWGNGAYQGANVMPLMTRAENPTTAMMQLHGTSTEAAANALKMAKRYGYDRVDFPSEIAGNAGTTRVVFDPANIRSRFAAFNPLKRHEADLLASWLLPAAGLSGILGYLASGDGYQ